MTKWIFDDELFGALFHELDQYYLTSLLKTMRISADNEGLYPEWITSVPSMGGKLDYRERSNLAVLVLFSHSLRFPVFLSG
jgi:hypothetical protein